MSQPPHTRLTHELIQQAHQNSLAQELSVLAALVQLSGKTRRELLEDLAGLFHMSLADMADLQRWTPAFDLLPLAKAMKHQSILFRDEARLIGILSDPFDADTQQWLESLCAGKLEIYLALSTDIQAFFKQAETRTRAMERTLPLHHGEQTPQRRDVEALSLQSISEDLSPIVRLVNSTLYDALKAGASDIHLECSPLGMTVRYRIDGVLDNVTQISGIDMTEQVISRIKVMAELDISERRIPQDGRFRVSIQERDVDIRVSVMPSNHGEDAVLRILDKRTFIADNHSLRLDMLGFDPNALATVRRLAHEPYGMLLVTGPTGSGKTTTLYAAISETNLGREKIVTIEDPVEYELAGVLQIPVNEKKGLSFARGLRSILRHDPDKIMVGEIRDRETAEIAVQSALTGHLVMTTVHANNVFDVFSRFTHMGIDAYALTSALNGIWAQRLVRLVCPHCAREHFPSAKELETLGLEDVDLASFSFRTGEGCGDCRGTGYRGRKAIAEILVLTDILREMIAQRQPVSAIKEIARKNGTHFLRESALALAYQGETTLEEVARVTLSA